MAQHCVCGTGPGGMAVGAARHCKNPAQGFSWGSPRPSSLQLSTQNHELLFEIMLAHGQASFLLYHEVSSPSLVRLLLISIGMSCPISCLFLTSRALLPSLFVSLLSAQCCWLGSLGRALTTLPSSLIASTLHLSSNSRSHLSLPQSFSSFLKSAMI